MLDDMKAAGAPPHVIEAARARLAPRLDDAVLAIHPDNVTVVKLFDALRTQWRVAPLSTMERAQIVQLGLDYAVVETTARLAGLTLGEGDFDRLRLMEAEGLKALAEARA